MKPKFSLPLFLSFLSFLLVAFAANAQSGVVLYGTTSAGGLNGTGVLYKINPDGTGMEVVYHFTNEFINLEGFSPIGDLAVGSNGKLHGVCYLGGDDGSCTLWEHAFQSDTCLDLHDFNHATGYIPRSGLYAAPNGILYGVTCNGGTYNNGVLYSFDPLTGTYSPIHHFTGQSDGASPISPPVMVDSIYLYGTALAGGAHGDGVIYRYNVNTGTFEVRFSFSDSVSGRWPEAGLTLASNGDLYGMASRGGNWGFGNIFRFDPGAGDFFVLHDFDAINGSYPQFSLIEMNEQYLYGVTPYDSSIGVSGALFHIGLDGTQFGVDHRFRSASGGLPSSNLSVSGDGKLYGACYYGGASNLGVIYSYHPLSQTYTVLNHFDTANGSYPKGGLLHVSSPVSVSIPHEKQNLVAYPVPAQDRIFFSTEESASLEILDVRGLTCWRGENPAGGIEVSAWPEGLYFFNSITRKGKVQSGEFLVLH